jgi:hypothetical protein
LTQSKEQEPEHHQGEEEIGGERRGQDRGHALPGWSRRRLEAQEPSAQAKQSLGTVAPSFVRQDEDSEQAGRQQGETHDGNDSKTPARRALTSTGAGSGARGYNHPGVTLQDERGPMAALALKAAIGALVVIVIALLSKSRSFYIAGMVPLFPSFALIAHYIVGNRAPGGGLAHHGARAAWKFATCGRAHVAHARGNPLSTRPSRDRT